MIASSIFCLASSSLSRCSSSSICMSRAEPSSGDDSKCWHTLFRKSKARASLKQQHVPGLFNHRFQEDNFLCLFREMRDHTCSLPRAVLLCSSTPPEEPHSPVALTALTWEGTCLEGTHLWGRKHTMHKLQFQQRYQAHQTLLPHLGCGF